MQGIKKAEADLVERAQKVLPGGSLGAFALPSGQETVMTRGLGA